MGPIVAAASNPSFVFFLSATMLGVGASALIVRIAKPSISVPSIVLFRRITYALFIAYLLVTFHFFWLIIWVVLGSGAESRHIRNTDRNLLVVLGVVLLLQGTVGVLDEAGIVYMRPAVLITAGFLMLIGLIWAAFVESKKEYPIQKEETTSERNH